MRIRLFAAVALLIVTLPSYAGEPIRLANNPSLSPDGSLLTFDWAGDIWLVPTAGGSARALTQHPGKDTQPKFSADASEIAFVSDRDGSPQIYVMPSTGGTPTRLTYHTAGYGLEGWTPDGKKLLVRAQRDHHWKHAERFFLIDRTVRPAEELLFDDYGSQGQLSPDGRKLLFVREGAPWWRKGYHGSQAAQVWQYDLDSKEFTKVCCPDRGANWPLWKPDGRGCYVASSMNGNFNIFDCDPVTHNDKQLTNFADDSVVQSCISHDGKMIVFRHLFDLYSFAPESGKPPMKIAIEASGDRVMDPIERRTLSAAQQVAFAVDGLEIAFTAGGDLWVMDTELREPKRITTSAEEERDPIMAPDGKAIYFVSDMHGECNIWRAERTDATKWWWQQSEFKLTRLTQDASVKSRLKVSPNGQKIAFVRDRGDLMVIDADGKNVKRIVPGFSTPEFDWSPDSAWLVYAAEDADFNRDVWIAPIDGSKPAFNLSRTPFDEHFPCWSHDGKVIAWTGRRSAEETDVHYVFLRAEDDQTSSRDRTLEKALDKMRNRRLPGSEPATPADGKPATTNANVQINFDGIHDRVHFVAIPDSTETDLFWSANGKRLAFSATVEGKRGTFAIDIPDDPRPKSINTGVGSQARWLKSGQVVWLVNGIPASFTPGPTAPAAQAAAAPPSAGGAPRRRGGPTPGAPSTPAANETPSASTEYRFAALQSYDRGQKHAAAFDQSWRTMRDQYYDGKLNNKDWDAIRRKYIDMARSTPDVDSLQTVVNLMLGELNGSHLGFFPGNTLMTRNQPPAEPGVGPKWNESTAHLGVRFDPTFAGPGLKVRDVIPGSPASMKRSEFKPGDVILAIDGKEVSPHHDLTSALNVAPGAELALKVRTGETERTVTMRPMGYAQTRQLLYKKWIDDNRAMVDKLSDGKLGYLHIDAMAMPSFYRFQAELYSVGHGKDGLVIDVRENGGGSTADHLLTALCQPEHAITVPRGGSPGYPQDRRVYATWSKPIVVLCNQNSFSNAEIFSHAIKTLKRGRVVGVPTAGGVISTGAAQIMDVGMLRLPFRGWYLLNDGKDMELNGAAPDFVVWPRPGEIVRGKDAQLEKGVQVLREDVTAWLAKPRPKLVSASETEPKSTAESRVAKDGQ